MNRKNIYLAGCITIIAVLPACAPKQSPFYFDTIPPPPAMHRSVPQYLAGLPPLYRPMKQRGTIDVDSKLFRLAILNAIDSSGGRAHDLRKSLANMLTTQIYATGRFDLYDRNELIQFDAEWLAEGARRLTVSAAPVMSQPAHPTTEKVDKAAPPPTTAPASNPTAGQPANAAANDAVGITTRVIDSANQTEMIERIKRSADGMLVSYITSRTGAAGGGKFHLDYRIVSTNPKNSIVLFAASKEIRYTSSSADEVDYNREDLKQLAEEIFNVFPNPDRTHKAQVASIDGDRITIDMGKDLHVLPGMRGYVIAIENKILTAKGCCVEHISYLAKFQVTEVEHKYSTAVIIEAPDEQHDIRVGDAAVFK